MLVHKKLPPIPLTIAPKPAMIYFIYIAVSDMKNPVK